MYPQFDSWTWYYTPRGVKKNWVAPLDHGQKGWNPRWRPRWPPQARNAHRSWTEGHRVLVLVSTPRFSGSRNSIKPFIWSLSHLVRWNSKWRPRWPTQGSNVHRSWTECLRKFVLVSTFRFLGSRNPIRLPIWSQMHLILVKSKWRPKCIDHPRFNWRS